MSSLFEILSSVSGASGSNSRPAGVIVAGMGVNVESGFSAVLLTLILCKPKIPIKVWINIRNIKKPFKSNQSINIEHIIGPLIAPIPKINCNPPPAATNFSLGTNQDRPEIMNNLLEKGFTKNKKLAWDYYIEDLSIHKFCISPEGNGVDCHRTWECLYLSVIPIIKKSTCMSHFDDLPILFVDNYDVISVEYLNKKYEDFQKIKFNFDKLSISYWKKKIKSHFESLNI